MVHQLEPVHKLCASVIGKGRGGESFCAITSIRYTLTYVF
jgi:hypothetical protein